MIEATGITKSWTVRAEEEEDDPISGNHYVEEDCCHSVSVGINVTTHKTIVDYLL
jgi:hypothetical protein